MNIERISKPAFAVIGKEGSTEDGAGFVQRLWQEANAHFGEIAHLAKRDDRGNLAGLWGAMTDMSRSFRPWDDFSRGLYLAGAEVRDDAEPPEGWVKWVVPALESLRVEHEDENTFNAMLDYLKAQNTPLAAAVQEYTCPLTGKEYILFPVRRL